MQQPDYQRIAERSSDGYFRYLSGQGLTYFTPGFSHLLDHDHADFSASPMDLPDLIHEPDKDEFEALINRLLRGQVDRSAAVLRLLKSDQSPVWVELFAVPTVREDEGIVGFDGLVRDVSEHLQVADLLSRRSLELSALLEAQKSLAASLDFEKTLQTIVEQAQELLEAQLSVIFLPDSDSGQLQPMADAGSIAIPTEDLRFLVGEGVSGWVMAHGEAQLVESLAEDQRGGRLVDRLDSDVCVMAAPLRIADKVAGTITVVGDVSQFRNEDLRLLGGLAQVASLALVNSKEYQVVEHRATIDGLTGAHNRLFLEENLPAELKRADRLDYPLAVIMVDIDDLKEINDLYGHPAGDEVLQHLVTVLRRNSRETDWIARYGGDEFVVILPGCPRDHLNRLGEKIQKDLTQSDKPHKYSISMGGAVRKPGVGGAERLLQLADKAERQSKHRGGGTMSLHAENKEAQIGGEGG